MNLLYLNVKIMKRIHFPPAFLANTSIRVVILQLNEYSILSVIGTVWTFYVLPQTEMGSTVVI